jgi:NAD(P)H-dependent FMN reductase
VGILDLAEVALPFLDEPESPRLRNYSKPHTKAWSAKIDAADAFAFVMPEYNHGFNAPLKNAIDYLNFEWRHKPVGFVSYGGPAAGTRAVLMLEPVLTALRMTPVAEAVNVAWVNKLVTVEGVFQPTETLERGAGAMLDALARTERALRDLRESV